MLASTAPKIAEYTTLAAIEPLWSIHSTMCRIACRRRPKPMRTSGTIVP